VENIHHERAIVRAATMLHHHKHASSAFLTWNLCGLSVISDALAEDVIPMLLIPSEFHFAQLHRSPSNSR
jgi:hypothetical protein